MGDGRENLIPMSERSKDEAKELGRKGGKASGRSRRQRASFLEAANALLAAPVKDKALKAELKAAGMEEINGNSLFILRLYKQAIHGDVQAARLFTQIVGEDNAITNEVVKRRLDLAYLRLEALIAAPSVDESDSSLIEALRDAVCECWEDYEQGTPHEETAPDDAEDDPQE